MAKQGGSEGRAETTSKGESGRPESGPEVGGPESDPGSGRPGVSGSAAVADASGKAIPGPRGQRGQRGQQGQQGQWGRRAGRLPSVPGFAEWPVRSVPGARSPKGEGKVIRGRVPRGAHAEFTVRDGRPDPVTAVRKTNHGRLPELTPIRTGRMAASPFAFLRGSAGLMAYDLAAGPVTGIGAQICGDAHAGNFGLYGDARGGLIIDLNDFDETAHGPWEWDVKRLAASLVLAGREAGASDDVCEAAARDAVGAYRRTMRLLAKLPALDAWNAIADEELVSHTDARDLLGTLEKVAEKARQNTSARFAAKATERVDGADGSEGRRFLDAPPVLRRIPDAEAAAVAGSLGEYLRTLTEDRLPLLARYAIQDVAFRVVGTGSVGLRSYVVLLLDHRGEPLVLQVKEARSSALAPHLPEAGFKVPEVAHEGHRVVLGQKRMQVVSDFLLGWTTVDGLPYQVRQFRNRKGSVDPVALSADQLDDYGRMTGALLARAHAHSADPRLIAGYCGKNDELDEAMTRFAKAYADRTEQDHTLLVRAIKEGRVAAETGV